LEEDVTEFLDTDGDQIAGEVTGLTAAAEEEVAAPPELVWDLVADVTRVGDWSPECVRAAWLGEPGRPQRGARFTGHNRFPNGFGYEVTCVVTEADRPRAFAWVVLDDSGDPARPSSSWRYRIDALPGGGSRVRQRFTHGPGASYLRTVAAKAPALAAEIIAARRDGLRANMSATLRAMKSAAESSSARGARPGEPIGARSQAGVRHAR
jgi:Polyketide cyclase / dehydrase and lipid transport